MFVVTGATEDYWKEWGRPFMRSLRAGGFAGPVILLTYNDFSPPGVTAVRTEPGPDYRLAAYKAICTLGDGFYAYWDADVYFQADVSELAKNEKLCVCENLNPGFVCGPSPAWREFAQLAAAVGRSAVDLLKAAAAFRSTEILPNDWNFIDIPFLESAEPKVVHPVGDFKLVRHALLAGRRPGLLALPKPFKRILLKKQSCDE